VKGPGDIIRNFGLTRANIDVEMPCDRQECETIYNFQKTKGKNFYFRGAESKGGQAP